MSEYRIKEETLTALAEQVRRLTGYAYTLKPVEMIDKLSGMTIVNGGIQNIRGGATLSQKFILNINSVAVGVLSE